ncbi:putative 3-hexulose-6-phosphate isomerase [Helianthus anomalus]
MLDSEVESDACFCSYYNPLGRRYNHPPISSSNLHIASAGPGGFSTVDAICGVAKSNGGRVLVLTAQLELGSSVKYANSVA